MKIFEFVDWANTRLGQLISYLIWVGGAILVFEVVARYVFGAPTIWAHGYTQRVFGAYFILIGAYTLVRGNHVRVDLALTKNQSRRNGFLDTINYSFLLIWAGAMVIEGWAFFQEAWNYGEVDDGALGHSMWPVKLTLFVGALLIAIQGAFELARAVLQMVNPQILGLPNRHQSEGDFL